MLERSWAKWEVITFGSSRIFLSSSATASSMAKFNATSVYAFVAWIASMVVFVIFLVWAFSPRSWFHELGITYYPSRYYAIALPAYMIVIILVINMSYIGINLLMTLEPDDMFTIRDNQAISSPNVFIKCSTTGGMLQTDFYLCTSKTATIISTVKIPRAQPSLCAKYWILLS